MSAEQESADSQEPETVSIDQAPEANESATDNNDSEVDAAETGPTVKELTGQLEQANAKAQENWDKALRIQAEMENLKKRTQKDIENAHKYALEGFAKELLTVVDSLEMGIQAAASDVPEVVKLKEGSELTLKQFQSALSKFKVEAIDPTGSVFDPEQHQAMSMQETDEVAPNTVVMVFQKGYQLNGRIIRPAMVVVAKALTKNTEDG